MPKVLGWGELVGIYTKSASAVAALSWASPESKFHVSEGEPTHHGKQSITTTSASPVPPLHSSAPTTLPIKTEVHYGHDLSPICPQSPSFATSSYVRALLSFGQPSIIFFDEIDGLAPVRSVKQDQIHASVVSTLLALMDGLDSRGQVRPCRSIYSLGASSLVLFGIFSILCPQLPIRVLFLRAHACTHYCVFACLRVYSLAVDFWFVL